MRQSMMTLALALGAACSSEPETPARASAPPSEPARSAPAASERPDPGSEPARPGNPLTFTPRAGWVVETPSSSMRVAQYRLPGDAGAAELVVYYFGAEHGGSLQANLERWAGQFEQPDGGDSLARAVLAERRVLGMPVHEVSLSGTYVAETSPGSGERVREPGWRLRAAILESDHGPYYAKLVGPEATVSAHESAFRAFISEVR
jgi:hypothetical protein